VKKVDENVTAVHWGGGGEKALTSPCCQVRLLVNTFLSESLGSVVPSIKTWFVDVLFLFFVCCHFFCWFVCFNISLMYFKQYCLCTVRFLIKGGKNGLCSLFCSFIVVFEVFN